MAISRTSWIVVASLSVIFCCAVCVEAQVLSPEAVAETPTYPLPASAAEASDAAPAEEGRSFWPKMSMPKVTMPKLSMPSWPKNEDGISKSPFTPISEGVSSGMKAISNGTKKAWQGTKNMFSFGGEEKSVVQATPVATSSTERRSLWDRLKGEEPEPDGPQTVAEWMSQPRLNP